MFCNTHDPGADDAGSGEKPADLDLIAMRLTGVSSTGETVLAAALRRRMAELGDAGEIGLTGQPANVARWTSYRP